MKRECGSQNLVSLFLRLTLFVLIVIISLTTANAQFSVGKTRKGVYGAKKKYTGKQQGRRNKSYRPTSKQGKAKYKNNKKRVKQRQHQKKRRNNHIKRKRKHSLKGRSKSLYGNNKKNKRKGKGKYPKRRSDMSSKLGVTMFTGVVLTGQGGDLNSAGQIQNILANYQPAPSLGMGFEYNYTPNLSIGANLQALPLSRDNLKVRALTLTVEAKYYLGNKRSKVRPYGLVGVTYSFAGISQEGYFNERSIDNGKLDPSYSVEDNSHILVERIEREEPEIQTALIPMFGYKLGIGAEFKLNQNWALYSEIDLHSSFAKNSVQILEFFPAHNGNFNFLTFKVGVKMNLMKSKSLY